MMEKLRRDSYGVGIILGMLVPAVLFGILYGIYMLVVAANPQINYIATDIRPDVLGDARRHLVRESGGNAPSE